MHSKKFFSEVVEIAERIDCDAVEAIVSGLWTVRENGGRLFLLGVGGSAGNCSHAVNDFRKLCGFDASSPIDNVSELTARANDEGWDTIFSAWLEVSRANEKDAILIFSVGGGDKERGVSTNIVSAIDFAKERGLKIYGIVGRGTGHTAKHADAVVIVPEPNPAHVTPHSEAFQAVVWHCIVSHPDLQVRATKW